MPVGATVGAAALGAAGNLAGGLIQSNAASNASKMQQAQYQQTRSDLLPFTTAGQGAANMLTGQLPSLTAPINMDMATLQQTPGFQFNLNQGLQAVQNSAAARGLGASGAAMRGAADYASGLASNTYATQFNNALQNKQFSYNALMGTAGLGANAAAQTGQQGTNLAQGAAAATYGAGTALAGGLTGGTNALTAGANNFGGYNMAQQQLALQNQLLGNTAASTMYGGGANTSPNYGGW